MSGALTVSEFATGANLVISNFGVGRVTKKVRRRLDLPVDIDDPTVDGNGLKVMEDNAQKISYRNKLMGSHNSTNSYQTLEDFEVQEDDVKIEVIDGIPSIIFSDRVVWVRLLGLPEGYYSNFILKAIGQAIGPMIKIDDNTEKAKRGHFVRMVVCVDLRKPLLSKIKINERRQRIEYDSLPNVCFGFGLYGHSIDACPKDRTAEPMEENNISAPTAKKQDLQQRVEEGMDYNRGMNQGRSVGGSRFNVLNKIHGGNDIVELIVEKERTTEEDKGKENRGGLGSKKLANRRKNGLNFKGRGVISVSGPKEGLIVLKPITNSGGLLLGKGQNGLDDRAKMGKASELDGENLFRFQAIQFKALLDGRKNKAVRIIQARQNGLSFGVDTVNFKFEDSSMVGENMGQRSTLRDDIDNIKRNNEMRKQVGTKAMADEDLAETVTARF
ncbi:hypothetical protein Gogos_012745 [Gossypium gossypioides]|uniref:DUF4283 domain-containing protein n=2 Tax=Gossypium TaxID=3633 RepID=A0A7J9BTG3_GOSGO|nr:hypothetical protein [Gossypium gossypioides]